MNEEEYIREHGLFVGGKIYITCEGCGKLIRYNKPIVGSLHICSPTYGIDMSDWQDDE